MKRFLVLLVFLLTINSALAQLSTGESPGAVTGWLGTLGSYTLLLWIIGGALIFGGYIIFRPLGQFGIFKWMCVAGLFVILLATFGVEIAYLLPYLGKPVVTITTCTEIFPKTPDVITNVVVGAACVFSGYTSSDNTALAISTFLIFGIIAPLAFFTFLFYEFTDFITSSANVRKAISFVSALIAFRFLLASMFTELLGYGFAGLGLLGANLFFFMVLFSMIKKLWVGYEATEMTLAVEDREMLSMAIKRRDDLQHTIAFTSDPKMKAAYQKDLDHVNEEIKKYMKSTKLPKV